MTFEQLEIFEEWKQVPGYEGLYLASSFGRIMSLPKFGAPGGLMTLLKDQGGYLKVSLSKNDKRKKFGVHQLVALAFIGPVPEGKEVDHKDADRTNNTVKNLRYLTRRENVQHGVSLGSYTRFGEESNAHKLTEKEVREIRYLRIEGFRAVALAIKFGISLSQVKNIIARRQWKEVE